MHRHVLTGCKGVGDHRGTFGDVEAIRREVLRKLNAAKGGGLIFQSDHSVSSGVSGKTYDFVVNLVREYGKYPLDLGEFDEDI